MVALWWSHGGVGVCILHLSPTGLTFHQERESVMFGKVIIFRLRSYFEKLFNIHVIAIEIYFETIFYHFVKILFC